MPIKASDVNKAFPNAVMPKELNEAIAAGRGDEPRYKQAIETCFRALARLSTTDLLPDEERATILSIVREGRPGWFDADGRLRPAEHWGGASENKPKRVQAAQTTELGQTVKHDASNVNRAAVQALSSVTTWKPGVEGLAHGVEQTYKDLRIAVGLPDGKEAEMWPFLCTSGPQMVKAYYALWARWYEAGGDPRQYITVGISQFCADVGYQKHHKGGFRRLQKQEAIRHLEALTSIEIRAYYTPAGKTTHRLRGPLWARGLIAEESDQYGDLFGQAREGRPEDWEPVSFSYAPGPWFTNPEWSQRNRYIGKLSVGLLRLSNESDQWAILIGGYLATLARTKAYQPFTLRVETILQKTNLAQSPDARRRMKESQGKFEQAMARLVEVGVIQSWRFGGEEVAEMSDPDDPAQIAAYYAEEPAGSWRAQLVEITLPHEEDMKRLEAARANAAVKTRRRAGRPRKAGGEKPAA